MGKQIPLSAKRRRARMAEGYEAHREGKTTVACPHEGWDWDSHFWHLGWWKREYEVNP